MVSPEEIQKIASLSRIAVNEDETEHFTKDMNQILNYIEKLNELDTSAVEPTAHILDLHNITREDTAKKGLEVSEIIDLAPQSEGNFIVVPRVL